MELNKSVLLGVGAVVILAVAALLVVLVYVISPQPPPFGGTDFNNAPGNEVLCGALDGNGAGLLAVASDKNIIQSIVSAKNEKAPFFLLVENRKETGLVDNSTAKTPEEVANLLKSKNVKGVVINSPQKSFVEALKSRQIQCYSSTGAITVALKIISSPSSGGGANTSYCSILDSFTALKGKKTILALDENTSSSVSSLNEKSNYLLVFDSNKITAIKNTTLDNNLNQLHDFVVLLRDNDLNTIILANANKRIENEFKANNITCYRAGGKISSIIIK